MDQLQLLEQAKKMYLENKGRKDVITFFKLQGVEEIQAENIATEAYKSIRAIRNTQQKEAAAQNYSGAGFSTEATSNKSTAMISLIIGLLICGAGIAASIGTNRIFYGTILVGGILFLKGLSRQAATAKHI